MSLMRTGLPIAPILYTIVHLESGLWQVGKAEIIELGGNRKGRIGSKGLEWQAGGKRRGWRPERHWRGWIIVSREENGAGSWRAASVGRDGIQVQQGLATGWAE